MKTIISKILLVVLLVSPALTIAASPVHNKIITTPFTGSETFAGMPDPNPGTIKVVDGKTITKGWVVYDLDDMSDPRVSGDLTVIVNSVYEGEAFTGVGPLWGTIHITNDGGGWNVKFAGYQSDGCQTIVYAQGKGEGDYKGMKAVWVYQSSDCMFTSSVSGSITEH